MASTYSEQEVTADQLRDFLNQWPTFAAQKIVVEEVTEDFQRAVVRLDLTSENANYFGTAFGGSLFSMVDPFVVILTAKQLGQDYAVWDQSVEIDFRKPGTGPVTARIDITPEQIEEIRTAAAGGDKVLHWFEVPLRAEDGSIVAVQRRQLYIRRKRDA